MEQFKLIGYQLVREDVVRDSFGDIEDWKHTIIAESKTVKGLVQFARLKKLDVCQSAYGFYIESVEKEYMPNYVGEWARSEGNIYPRKSLWELL